MATTGNIVPESTIYRRVSDELIVIQLDTGYFYYFNPDTQEFLDFFKEAKSIEDYFDAAGLTSESQAERLYLNEFCDFLLKNNILRAASMDSTPPSPRNISYRKPGFLRKGEKTLDEITFLCP